MARPVTPVRSEMAWWRWTFIWLYAFCMCNTLRAAVLIKVSRWRSTERSTHTSSAGRNEPRSNPTECR